jgi:hypothetical protein
MVNDGVVIKVNLFFVFIGPNWGFKEFSEVYKGLLYVVLEARKLQEIRSLNISTQRQHPKYFLSL